MIPPFKSIYAGQEQNEEGINGNYFKHYISHILATTSTKKISDLKNTTTMLTATMSTTITKYHLQRCWYNRHFSLITYTSQLHTTTTFTTIMTITNSASSTPLLPSYTAETSTYNYYHSHCQYFNFTTSIAQSITHIHSPVCERDIILWTRKKPRLLLEMNR